MGTAGLRGKGAQRPCAGCREPCPSQRVAQITEGLSCVSSRGAGPRVRGKRRQVRPALGLRGSVGKGSSLRGSGLRVELGEGWRPLRTLRRSHTECRATGEQEEAGRFGSVVRPREPQRCGLASVEDCRARVQLQL